MRKIKFDECDSKNRKNPVFSKKSILTVIILMLAPITAQAVPQYTSQFNAFYGTTGGYDYQPVMGSCLTCHPSGSRLNSYAGDWRNAQRSFKAVEQIDSDSDGYDNLTEITADAFPGDPNSFPETAPPDPGDTTAPNVVGLSVPLGFYDLTIPVGFTAEDDTAVTGYLLTESAAVPSATHTGWQPAPPTDFTFQSAGANSIYAWAKDSAGNISPSLSRTVTIEVYSPVADAGSDQSVKPGDSVLLDGGGSALEQYGIAVYGWTQDSGPTITLSDSDVLQPTFTAPETAPGTSEVLVFTLTVTDIYGKIFTDKCAVNISVSNTAPTADAGGLYSAVSGDTVILDGSGSMDTDDGIASYSWVQTAGTVVSLTEADTDKPSFVAPPVGDAGETLTFELVVTDLGGLKATDTCTIDVSPLVTLPWEEIPGVVTMGTYTGEPVGIGVSDNAEIGNLTGLDPAEIPDTEQKPINMSYGLIDIQLNVNPGDTASVTVYLPEPAPAGYHWYKYYENTTEWEDYCCTIASETSETKGAVFNATRDQVTLTLTDGGYGDDDMTVDGSIFDPSGLGIMETEPPPSQPGVSSGSSGSGGCFISGIDDPDAFPGKPVVVFFTILTLFAVIVRQSIKSIKVTFGQ